MYQECRACPTACRRSAGRGAACSVPTEPAWSSGGPEMEVKLAKRFARPFVVTASHPCTEPQSWATRWTGASGLVWSTTASRSSTSTRQRVSRPCPRERRSGRHLARRRRRRASRRPGGRPVAPHGARVREAVDEHDGRSATLAVLGDGQRQPGAAYPTLDHHRAESTMATPGVRRTTASAAGYRVAGGVIDAFSSARAAASSADRFRRAASAEASCSPSGARPPERMRWSASTANVRPRRPLRGPVDSPCSPRRGGRRGALEAGHGLVDLHAHAGPALLVVRLGLGQHEITGELSGGHGRAAPSAASRPRAPAGGCGRSAARPGQRPGR